MPDDPSPLPADEAAAALPQVDSPPADVVLEGVPSEQDVIAAAASADEIISAQPSVDELLGR